jgi:hypothetical protein
VWVIRRAEIVVEEPRVVPWLSDCANRNTSLLRSVRGWGTIKKSQSI